nr:uncharacterized protein LOC109430763 [Aedes albopictus]
MFKLIVAVFALVAIASAFPSDLEQPVQVNKEAAPVPVQADGVPLPGPVAVAADGNKESLENAETFGYGYYGYYPRYYYGGYYPRYYGYGGYGYGYGYPRYYW